MGNETISPFPVIADGIEIYAVLSQLGITANYAGFRQSAWAVYLAMQNPDRLCMASKWLYPETAERFCVTACSVEGNIRRAAQIAWEVNPELLNELAGHPLRSRPKATQFISILAFHFLRTKTAG